LEATPVLEITGLTKSFPIGFLGRKRRRALGALDLKVHRNEIFGYLGPNGAGKTTTLKILMGLLFPDSGSVTILGDPLRSRSWRYRAGFLPEQPHFYDWLTAREYLDYVGRLFGLRAAVRAERSRQLFDTLGLARHADLALGRLSKGLVQRVGLAQALLNDPEILFLDEPMSGLDPIGRYLVRNIILDLKRRGKTIFFSTHILSDAESLCDRVALLRGGELVKVGRLDEILGLEVAHMEVLVTGVEPAALERLPPGVKQRHPVGERWRLELAEESLNGVLQALQAAGGRILSVQPVRASLEEYFFREMVTPGGPAERWEAGD
jgi:ABC-2 type transport system ATP-binding protein